MKGFALGPALKRRRNHLLMHLSICNLNTLGGAFEFFDFWRSNSPSFKKLFKCPTCKTRWPPLGHFFYRLTGQDRFKTICYKYYLSFFIIG